MNFVCVNIDHAASARLVIFMMLLIMASMRSFVMYIKLVISPSHQVTFLEIYLCRYCRDIGAHKKQQVNIVGGQVVYSFEVDRINHLYKLLLKNCFISLAFRKDS